MVTDSSWAAARSSRGAGQHSSSSTGSQRDCRELGCCCSKATSQALLGGVQARGMWSFSQGSPGGPAAPRQHHLLLLGTGTGCPAGWWGHQLWRCPRNVEMWSVGNIDGRWMVGLDWIPLEVFSNPYGSTSPTSPSQHRVQDGQRRSHIPLSQPLLCEEGFLAHPLLSSSCPTCLARQL